MGLDLDNKELKARRIKVGEYVRLRGDILKIEQILNINKNEDYCYIVFKEYASGNGFEISEVNKWKHSKNKIDLIEVGDYVNGHRVTSVYNSKTISSVYIENEHSKVIEVMRNEIKSIVTKEQFAQMEYKVKE